MIKNTALVLEGGGFRGIFTAGILEVFLENKLFFESVYGVSAGAAYAVSYLSKQAGRNIAVNDYIGDPRYFGWNHLLRDGSLFSWDFIYEEIPQKIIPFDYQALKESDSKLYVGTTNCLTGEAEFFLLNEADQEDFKRLLSATGSLPLIAPMVSFDGKLLLDGGLADSIPYEYALSHGNARALIILTQARSYLKEPLKYAALFKWFYRKYPKVYELLLNRADRYNAAIHRLEQLEKEGQVYLIRPEGKLLVSRLENNPQKTAQVYANAMALARNELPHLQKWLNQESFS